MMIIELATAAHDEAEAGEMRAVEAGLLARRSPGLRWRCSSPR